MAGRAWPAAPAGRPRDHHGRRRRDRARPGHPRGAGRERARAVSPPTRVAPRPAAGAGPAPLLPARRRVLGRRWPLLVAVVGGRGLVLVVGFTGVLGVRHVTVTGVPGAVRRPGRGPRRRCRPAGRWPGSTPARVAGRVRALPGVERVAVTRSWPGTLRITVTERRRRGRGRPGRHASGWSTRTAWSFQRLPAPAEAAAAAIGRRRRRDSARAPRAALAAVTALPPRLLAERRARSRAPTPEQVTLALTDGRDGVLGRRRGVGREGRRAGGAAEPARDALRREHAVGGHRPLTATRVLRAADPAGTGARDRPVRRARSADRAACGSGFAPTRRAVVDPPVPLLTSRSAERLT